MRASRQAPCPCLLRWRCFVRQRSLALFTRSAGAGGLIALEDGGRDRPLPGLRRPQTFTPRHLVHHQLHIEQQHHRNQQQRSQQYSQRHAVFDLPV